MQKISGANVSVNRWLDAEQSVRLDLDETEGSHYSIHRSLSLGRDRNNTADIYHHSGTRSEVPIRCDLRLPSAGLVIVSTRVRRPTTHRCGSNA